MLKFSIVPILSGVLLCCISGFADAQDQKVLSYFTPAPQVQSSSKTEENLWDGLSLAPNEPTPESSFYPSATRDANLTSTSKTVYWKSDCVRFENPVFGDPMLERYGIASSAQDLRTGTRFYLKSMVFPLAVLTGRNRLCVAPTDPFFKK